MKPGTLPAWLARRADAPSDVPFLHFGEAVLSAADLHTAARRIAGGLRQGGVERGDRVAILLPNGVESVQTLFATFAAGAVVVPVNTKLKAPELRHILDDAGVRALVTAGSFAGVVGTACEDLPSPPRVYSLDARVRDAVPFADLLASEPLADDAPVLPDDDAAILYTAGTEGRPKGAILTHGNLATNASQFAEVLSLSAGDRTLCALPLFHVFALVGALFAPLVSGGSVLLLRGFSPREFLEAAARLAPTVVPAVPTVFAILAGLPDDLREALAPVRVCLSGGAPLSERTAAAFAAKSGKPLLEGYGLTEATCACTVTPPAVGRKPGSVGRALPGLRVLVVGPDGAELPPGAVGEVAVEGPTVMRGYLNRPEETARAIRGGRLFTGDLGYLDEAGDLFLAGRKKDMLIRGGENIYPVEVERVVETHPGVAEAAVCGLPDELWGEQVIAFVVPAAGGGLVADDLVAHCKRHLADYKCPGRVQLVDELPRREDGTVDKDALVRAYRSRTET